MIYRKLSTSICYYGVLKCNAFMDYAEFHGFRIKATGRDGEIYDVEVQRSSKGFSPRRVRYYSALVDAHEIEAGKEPDRLREKYIIFIGETDYFEKDLGAYHFCTCMPDEKLVLRDGQHFVYVNGKKEDDTALGKLMQDFKQADPDKMHYSELAERVKQLKYSEKGNKLMGEVTKEIFDEGIEKGAKMGEERGEKKGYFNALLSAVRSLMSTTNKTPEEAMDMLGIKPSDRAKLLKAL